MFKKTSLFLHDGFPNKDNVNLHDCEIHQMEDKFEKQDGALKD